MELLLNLVWGVIVAAAAVRFATWSAGKPARTKIIVALATVCVLAILFPIISVTDDLHDSPALFEESRTAKVGFVVVLAILVAVATVVFRLRLIRAVADAPVHRVLHGVRIAIAIRPPPVFVR